MAFVGGWMDLTGRRKILMLLPVIGEILQNVSNILNVLFFYQLRVEYLIFLDAFFGAVAGGWSIMFLALFSYIADITTEANRTHRLGLVIFCTYIAMPVGLAVSGFILMYFGYYAIFGTAITMHCLNLMYIIFSLSDPPRSKEQLKHDGQGLLIFLKTFFNLRHIKDAFVVIFKQTVDNRRLRLFVLFGTACILYGPMYGEIAIMYM